MRPSSPKDGWEIEEILDRLSSDQSRRWLRGFFLPLLLAGASFFVIVNRQGFVPRGLSWRLHSITGTNAVIEGVVFACLALWSHSHWFWSDHPRLHGYAELGKIISLVGLIGSFAFAIFYSFVLS